VQLRAWLGRDDIMFRNDAGQFYSWDMNGTMFKPGAAPWADSSQQASSLNTGTWNRSDRLEVRQAVLARRLVIGIGTVGSAYKLGKAEIQIRTIGSESSAQLGALTVSVFAPLSGAPWTSNAPDRAPRFAGMRAMVRHRIHDQLR